MLIIHLKLTMNLYDYFTYRCIINIFGHNEHVWSLYIQVYYQHFLVKIIIYFLFSMHINNFN